MSKTRAVLPRNDCGLTCRLYRRCCRTMQRRFEGKEEARAFPCKRFLLGFFFFFFGFPLIFSSLFPIRRQSNYSRPLFQSASGFATTSNRKKERSKTAMRNARIKLSFSRLPLKLSLNSPDESCQITTAPEPVGQPYPAASSAHVASTFDFFFLFFFYRERETRNALNIQREGLTECYVKRQNV